jgi:signal transduction histidine kinase
MGITNLLIENVLLWVRSQMTGISISVEPLLLGNLVNEHLSLYETTAAQKKIRLVNEIHSALAVSADKHILSLALRNLISNAIKYSFENGTISVSANQVDGHVSLAISDNGTGMSESTVTRLLKREELTSEPGTQHEMGTGLGLMVSREYLLKMGSALTVESALGKGSTFRISLPG